MKQTDIQCRDFKTGVMCALFLVQLNSEITVTEHYNSNSAGNKTYISAGLREK